MFTAIAVVVSLAVGFGAGRVKNVNKLKAVAAVLSAVEAKGSAEVTTLVADVRKHL